MSHAQVDKRWSIAQRWMTGRVFMQARASQARALDNCWHALWVISRAGELFLIQSTVDRGSGILSWKQYMGITDHDRRRIGWVKTAILQQQNTNKISTGRINEKTRNNSLLLRLQKNLKKLWTIQDAHGLFQILRQPVPNLHQPWSTGAPWCPSMTSSGMSLSEKRWYWKIFVIEKVGKIFFEGGEFWFF